jgi:hypothetical protein
MTNQEKLFAAIRQVKLKPRLMNLLEEGITEATIKECIREWKETGITRATHSIKQLRTPCPEKARKAIVNAKYD